MPIGKVRRPYRGGELHGYGFAVLPKGEGWDADDIVTRPNHEVERVGYFDITEIHDGKPFLRVLGARIKAFLAGDEDADCLQYLSDIGRERCLAAVDDCSVPLGSR